MRLAYALVFLAACGGTADNTGTGTSTLLVDADVHATPEVANGSEAADFTTDFHVRVTLDGADVKTGTVTVSSDGGDVALIWDDADGRWRGAQAGYFEVYGLDVVSGDDNVRGVTIDGPDIHTFASPDGTASVDATVPLTIEWSRSDEADEADLESRETDRVAIPDTGSYQLAAGALRSSPDQTEEEELRLSRSARIVPTGAVAGSEVRVSIENRLPLIVAATGP